ncbi:MAG: AgmX/PglI C-terminal domain-containing protein [Polyangiales bacterium]
MDRRALLAFTLVACGTTQSPAPVTPPEAARAEPTRPRLHLASRPGGCEGASGGIQIEGQLGTIPVDNVRRVVREANEGLAACFHRRLEALPCLAGRVDLKLRVGVDGAVRWALPVASTMGDREVERCMVEHAGTLRFSAPCGGEAEVATSLEMDGGPDARPAVSWPATRLTATLRARRAQLAACRGAYRGEVRVSAYVARDGSVAAAGASVDDAEGYTVSECALAEIRSWRLPSPGSWYARVNFNLP